LTVEMVPGNHRDFSTYLAKKARAQSGACAKVHFPDYGTVMWSLAAEIVPGKHCDFSTYLAKGARAQSGACAEVQFPDYGTVLYSPGSRNYSWKALRFQHIFCQEGELSLAHAQMCNFLIMEQSCGPLAVEIVPGKNRYFSSYLAKRARAQSA
jgi:hypothetical protein